MYNNPKPNKEEFEAICKELEYSELTLRHVGRVFGQAFWELQLLAMSDARQAALLLEELRKKE